MDAHPSLRRGERASMGLGLAALGRPGYINIGHGNDVGGDTNPAVMRDRAHRVLDAAYMAGVRYFDAARSYGLAEEFLGSWLRARSIDPDDVIIASKWGYTYTAAWRVNAATHEVKDHSVDVFRRQLAESRSALGPHLDLYQIHSATLESGVLDDTEVVDALATAKAEGLRIGMSVSGPRQADTIWRALEIRRDGSRVFDAVQATWNLLERAAEPALRAAHAEGVSVIVKEAVANGRLTGRGIGTVPSSHAATITSEAERLARSIDALSIAFVVAQPWIDVVLSGATTVAQLESNLGALEFTIPPESIQRLADVVMDSATYWNARSALPWN